MAVENLKWYYVLFYFKWIWHFSKLVICLAQLLNSVSWVFKIAEGLILSSKESIFI